MSAFVVSHDHINAIVTWANHYERRAYRIADPQAVGQMLLDANNQSVQTLYRDRAADMLDPEPFAWRPDAARKLSPVEAIKLIQCLDYQCCEPDNYPDSTCAKALNELKNTAIAELDGYDAAPWAI